jgi:hypothetical protein
MSVEIRLPGDLFKVEYQPGDLFVLKIEGPVSGDIVNHIQDQWRELMPPDVRLMIVSHDADLSLYRKVGQ